MSQQTDVFDGSRLVAIISHAGPVLHKRQGIDYRPTRPTISPLQDDDDDDDDDGGEKGGNGGNSTWKPDPNAPALAKYTITNPIQILTVLILVLIILPAIVYTSALHPSLLDSALLSPAHSQHAHGHQPTVRS